MLNKIHTQISAMEMKLKPCKCRQLYFCGGRQEAISFHIGANKIVSIRDKEQKFREIVVCGKSENTFTHIKNKFTEGIANIEEAMLRSEFKLWIYSNYPLSSNIFLLTV